MRIVVTGAAGFIGSHLIDRLVAEGHDVVGVDCFTSYYDREAKERNLVAARQSGRFSLVEADLAEVDLGPLLDGAEAIFHQAGQPGVRLSWDEFHEYERNNVVVTQRLLQGAAASSTLQRLVYASSSSIYGNARSYPVTEAALPAPFSPYGVTKLAAEHLCRLYADNYGVPTVSLRYFTVYGPRQRPDMAFHRLIDGALRARPFHLLGDGSQIRDFTFVGDVVDANLQCLVGSIEPGAFFNVASDSPTTMRDAIAVVEEVSGTHVELLLEPVASGDVRQTGGDTSLAKAVLGWAPMTKLATGLADQVAWHLSLKRDS